VNPGSVKAGRIRLFAGLTVVGAFLLMSGVILVVIGEAMRLRTSAGWHQLVSDGEGLAALGLTFGVAVVVVMAAGSARPQRPGRRSAEPVQHAAQRPPERSAQRSTQHAAHRGHDAAADEWLSSFRTARAEHRPEFEGSPEFDDVAGTGHADPWGGADAWGQAGASSHADTPGWADDGWADDGWYPDEPAPSYPGWSGHADDRQRADQREPQSGPAIGRQGGYPAEPQSGQQGGYPAEPQSGQQGGYPAEPQSGQQGSYPIQPHSGQQGSYPAEPQSGQQGGYPIQPHSGQQGSYPIQPQSGQQLSYLAHPQPGQQTHAEVPRFAPAAVLRTEYLTESSPAREAGAERIHSGGLPARQAWSSHDQGAPGDIGVSRAADDTAPLALILPRGSAAQAAAAIGEDVLVEHFDEVSRRQRQLIREYFNQAGTGSGSLAATAGGQQEGAGLLG
jgi:hypothetical protein